MTINRKEHQLIERQRTKDRERNRATETKENEIPARRPLNALPFVDTDSMTLCATTASNSRPKCLLACRQDYRWDLPPRRFDVQNRRTARRVIRSHRYWPPDPYLRQFCLPSFGPISYAIAAPARLNFPTNGPISMVDPQNLLWIRSHTQTLPSSPTLVTNSRCVGGDAAS